MCLQILGPTEKDGEMVRHPKGIRWVYINVLDSGMETNMTIVEDLIGGEKNKVPESGYGFVKDVIKVESN